MRALIRGAGCYLVFGLGVIMASAIVTSDDPAVRILAFLLFGSLIGLVIYAMRDRGRGSPWMCASCGASNPEGSRGCGACGEDRT